MKIIFLQQQKYSYNKQQATHTEIMKKNKMQMNVPVEVTEVVLKLIDLPDLFRVQPINN